MGDYEGGAVEVHGGFIIEPGFYVGRASEPAGFQEHDPYVVILFTGLFLNYLVEDLLSWVKYEG